MGGLVLEVVKVPQGQTVRLSQRLEHIQGPEGPEASEQGDADGRRAEDSADGIFNTSQNDQQAAQVQGSILVLPPRSNNKIHQKPRHDEHYQSTAPYRHCRVLHYT